MDSTSTTDAGAAETVDRLLPAGAQYDAAALIAAVTEALDASGLAAGDGRVSDRLTARGLRWYRTIGLVDPPVARAGRRNVFTRRHGLQLLAVRALQAADGLSVADIQQRLHAADDDTLRRTYTDAVERAGHRSEPAATDRTGGAFWAAPTATATATRPAPAPAAQPAVVIDAAPGVTVVLTGAARDLDPTALVRAVAAVRAGHGTHRDT